MGSMKSKLLEFLESYSKPCEIDINNVATWQYDGMAVIQSLSCQSIPETMTELARLIFLIIIKHRCNYFCVDFICYRYPDVSVKK